MKHNLSQWTVFLCDWRPLKYIHPKCVEGEEKKIMTKSQIIINLKKIELMKPKNEQNYNFFWKLGKEYKQQKREKSL